MARRRATAASAALTLALAGTAGVATAASADDGPVEAGITVQKVEGMPDDFMSGMDVSSVLALEDSGVVFRDADGNAEDLFTLLADAGVTDVRVRVWNDPYDGDGNGYGGGTVDAARALEIGERATAAGLGLLVDFHYSDFWADPGRQTAPKAWTGLTVAEKADEVYTFTHDTLEAMAAEGVAVTMVQVGNETNNGVAGVSLSASTAGMADAAQLFDAGSAAVRDVYPDAKVALHFTDPQDQDYGAYADALDANGVDYDVFATSYYPFWHGSLENLTAQLSEVATDNGKEVLVAETSWVTTLDDGDGHPNVIDQPSEATQYPVSVQGQATAVRDVIQAVVDVGDAGIGVFYWEPAWLPVGEPADYDANMLLWEEFGSGWATSFAAPYDANVGEWYGGSAWDNQAMFAFDGTAYESLQVFAYARTGAVAPLEVTDVEQPTVEVTVGDDVVLPDTVTVTYNDGSTEEQWVEWDDVLGWISGTGTYPIDGVTVDGLETTATVVVSPVELLVNGGFEKGDSDITPWWFYADPWPSTFWVNWVEGTQNGFDKWAVNVWNSEAYSFEMGQDLDGLPAGDYTLSAQAMGISDLSLHLYAWTDSHTSPGDDSALTVWGEWDTMELTVPVAEGETLHVGIYGQGAADAWGWIDDVSLVAATPAGADTTALEALLADREAADRDLYTDWSQDEFDHALAVAHVVVGADAPSQDDVDAATELLAQLALLPDGSCSVTTKVHGTWPGGFNAQVWLTNTSEEDYDGWTMRWEFTGDEQVSHLWSGDYVQSGPDVAVTSKTYNGDLRAGKHLTFGFLGTTTSDDPGLAEVSVNGVACGAAG